VHVGRGTFQIVFSDSLCHLTQPRKRRHTWDVRPLVAVFRLAYVESYTKLEHNMYDPPQLPTANTCPNDRRKTLRYLITGAVRFEWQAVDGQWYKDIGITHDIGKGGVFIESDSIPQVGSPLKLTVTLPSASKPNTTLQLGGDGDVRHIRQEPSQTTGFGASAVFDVEVPMWTGNTEGGER
jgi:hypothetical protein